MKIPWELRHQLWWIEQEIMIIALSNREPWRWENIRKSFTFYGRGA